jgi:hypothetical protein
MRDTVLLGWAGMLDINGAKLGERQKDAPQKIAVLTRHALLKRDGLLRGIVFPAQKDLDFLVP